MVADLDIGLGQIHRPSSVMDDGLWHEELCRWLGFDDVSRRLGVLFEHCLLLDLGSLEGLSQIWRPFRRQFLSLIETTVAVITHILLGEAFEYSGTAVLGLALDRSRRVVG